VFLNFRKQITLLTIS